MNVYYIGGSPCAGKSTVAEILAKKYDLFYFKVDDRLDEHTKLGASNGYPICKFTVESTWQEIWMRDPVQQCKEEFLFYEEVWDYVLEDLQKCKGKKGIITEGAAFVPFLAKRIDIPYNRYIAITPTEEFQIFHYSKREFVPYILQDCEDKKLAFERWMKRDNLFGQEVQKQCKEMGYFSIINDGTISVDKLVEKVERHFGLEKLC